MSLYLTQHLELRLLSNFISLIYRSKTNSKKILGQFINVNSYSTLVLNKCNFEGGIVVEGGAVRSGAGKSNVL